MPTALLVALMVWAATAAGLPVPDTPPAVERADRADMWAAVYPSQPYREDAAGRPLAYYEHETRTVYLAHDWRPDSLRDVSILVHELVHDAQYRAGTPHRCIGELERVAYDVQRRFLEAAGADFHATIKINERSLFLVTRCDVQ